VNDISHKQVVPLVVVDQVFPVSLEVVQGVHCVSHSVEARPSKVWLILHACDPSQDESSSLCCVNFNSSDGNNAVITVGARERKRPDFSLVIPQSLVGCCELIHVEFLSHGVVDVLQTRTVLSVQPDFDFSESSFSEVTGSRCLERSKVRDHGKEYKL
jgi:hypothetical protein